MAIVVAKKKAPTHTERMALVRALLAHALMAHQDAMDNAPPGAGGPPGMGGPPGIGAPPGAGPAPDLGPPAGGPGPSKVVIVKKKPSMAFPFGQVSGRR